MRRVSFTPSHAGPGRRILVTAAAVLLAAMLLAGLAAAGTDAAPAPGLAATPSPSPTPSPSSSPVVIQPGTGLFAQFGYSPPFTRNVPTFDAAGMPYIRSRSADPDYTGFVNTLRDGAWVRLDFIGALRAAYPDYASTQGAGGGREAQVVFDAQDRAYTLVSIRLQGGGVRNVMLWSVDHCVTWHAVTLPDGEMASETWTGHNSFDGPPPLLVCRVTSVVDPYTGKLVRDLYFTRPRFSGDGIIVPPLKLISANALGLGDGASTASQLVTHGETTWMVWVETTRDPNRGSPVYLTTFDGVHDTLGNRILLAYSRPGNDGHAQPGIVIDSQGYLHVIAGAHGQPFQYRRTLVPYTAYEGWSQLEPVGTTGYRSNPGAPQEGRQTYLAFVCDQNDIVHLAYRQWRRDTDSWFGGALYGALSYQRRDPLLGWTEPQVLVVPPYADYSIYDQTLSLDHSGRLYLSASCTAGAEDSERKAAVAQWKLSGREGPQPPEYLRRMVLVSDDGGVTWRFAATADLAPRTAP